MSLVTHFPYPEIRPVQKAILEAIESGWDTHDVFCIVAPTALGKSSISKTLHNAHRSCSTITPTNMLVQQYLDEFPDTAALHRLDSYRCEKWQRPCSRTRNKLRNFCSGCPAGAALAAAKFRRGPGVYNYQTYIAHRIYRDVLIIDEAHLLIKTIQERFSTIIWKHDVHYPNSGNRDQLLRWLMSLPEKKRKGRKLGMLHAALTQPVPEYSVEFSQEEFNGKGTIRGEPEMRDCLRLIPNDVRKCPPVFWPDNEVSKVILLSATISRKDVEALGLSKKRVLYINGGSPIPPENRPVHIVPVALVNRGKMEEATSRIASYIEGELLPRHLGEKGLIHATYKQSELLWEMLGGNPRFMFHERDNKKEVYQKFRDSPVSEGRVLVASGLYEGIDLPGDLGRWQVIAKVPWLNLGSQVVKHNADKDSEWYVWETLKTVIQATGRICRTPTDFGATYILDSSIDRLIRDCCDAGLVPEWFLSAILT